MAVKFSTCYPLLMQGVRTPCGLVTEKQSGRLMEIICPELSVEVCSQLADKWNASNPSVSNDKAGEEELAQFITDELSGSKTETGRV